MSKKFLPFGLPLLLAALIQTNLTTARADAPSPNPLPLVAVKHTARDAAWRGYSVRTVATLAPLPAEPALDAYGGRRDRTAAPATGFFRTQQIGGRWWLVDPDGHPFLHVGVSAVSPDRTTARGTTLPAAFGGRDTWADTTGLQLRDWGFNGAGAWSSVPLLRAASPRLVYTVIGQTSAPGSAGGFLGAFATLQRLQHPTKDRLLFPRNCLPVFAPAFPAFCDTYAKPLAAFKDDPWLLGYFSDNELPLPILDNYLALSPTDPNREAAQKWLEERVGAGATRADIIEEDREDWAEYVFDRYFALTTAAIRKYDPNHLCLGSRLYGPTYNHPGVFAAAGRYLDVVAVNLYGVWNPKAAVARWAQWSGRPILISEFYVKGMDSGLANTTGAGWLVPTQRDRGLFYQNFTLGLLESRACVGWHWFKYMDNDPSDLMSDPSNRDANKGLVTMRYIPYMPLLTQMRALNTSVYALADHFDSAAAVPKRATAGDPKTP